MKKGYLKLLILIFFAMIIFSGNSYGIEIRPVQQKHEEEKQLVITTKAEAEEEKKEEPEEKGTVILFTIQEIAQDNDENTTEQTEDCSVISDAENEEPSQEESESTKKDEPVNRAIIKRMNTTNIKTNKNVKIGQVVNKIISKIYDETENIRQFINTANDKREKTTYSVEEVTQQEKKPMKDIGEEIENNLLYIQKYADNEEYNRLSC